MTVIPLLPILTKPALGIKKPLRKSNIWRKDVEEVWGAT